MAQAYLTTFDDFQLHRPMNESYGQVVKRVVYVYLLFSAPIPKYKIKAVSNVSPEQP